MSTPRDDGPAAAKQRIRERIWSSMRGARVARFPGAEGRIPNFIGAEAAARVLASTADWASASTVKSNPDAPQLPVRVLALADGKLLLMAVPRLRTIEPFLELDPARLLATGVRPREAASIGGASRHGVPMPLADVPRIDLIVCGTVAVNRAGVRIGKGGGYSDLELGLLREVNMVDDSTVIATTVHPIQVVDEDLPETEHDFRADLIVTPDGVIRTGADPGRRPAGILWGHLDAGKAAGIPVLARHPRTPNAHLRNQQNHDGGR